MTLLPIHWKQQLLCFPYCFTLLKLAGAIKSSVGSPQCLAISARTACFKRVISCHSLPCGVIGGLTVMVTRPGFSRRLVLRKIQRVPRIATEQRGVWVSADNLNAPNLKGRNPTA